MIRRILTGAVFCLSVAYAAANVNGVWNLNVTTSDFGPLPKMEKILMTIEQAEPSVQMTQEVVGPQGPYTAKLKYTTDGQQVTNTIGPTELKSTSKWDGDTLVIDSAGKVRGNDVKFTDKWTLSTDGKTLKMARHIVVTQGEFDQVLVYDKK